MSCRDILRCRVVVAFALVAITVPATVGVADAPAPPSTIPTSTVQFDAGTAMALTTTDTGSVVIAGRGGIPTTEIAADGQSTGRVWPTPAVDALAWADGALIVGTRSGDLQRWDDVYEPTWSVPIGDTVHDIAILKSGRRAVIGSYGEDPLVTVRLRDGQTLHRADLTGDVNGLALAPSGLRVAVTGRHLSAEGNTDRPHMLVYRVAHLGRLQVTGWDEPTANLHCRDDPSAAYITDVEWSPVAGPMKGHLAITATGRNRRPGWGLCDALTLIDGRPNAPTAAVWSQRTCNDSLTSLAWSPDGTMIAAAGHHKCVEWRPGGLRDYGRSIDAPVRPGQVANYADVTAYRWARTNALGLHISTAHDGVKTPPFYAKCRNDGAEAMVWTDVGLHVGHDCSHFGTHDRAGRWTPPELRWSVRASRYALLEVSDPAHQPPEVTPSGDAAHVRSRDAATAG